MRANADGIAGDEIVRSGDQGQIVGEMLDSPVDIELREAGARDVIQPDILPLVKECSSIIAEEEIRGAPEQPTQPVVPNCPTQELNL